MLGCSNLLSILDPVLVSRAHRVLHCIETPNFGWRLKENADVVCFEDEHNKAMTVTFVALTIGSLAFLWTIILPYGLFVCRPPSVAVGTIAVAPTPTEVTDQINAEAAGKVRAALYQVGLDRPLQILCCKCTRNAPQIRVRNVEMHIAAMDDVDGTLIAFGSSLDADLKPHAYWFGPLQVAVSALLGVFVGVFGGSHAAGLVRSKTAHFFAGAFSITLLVAFATIAVAVHPFRPRSRDSWKLYGLVGSVSVASLSEVLAFMLSLRTRPESVVYSEICMLFGGFVVLSCVLLFVMLISAYLVAMRVPHSIVELGKRIYDVTILPLRVQRHRDQSAAAEAQEDGRAGVFELANVVRTAEEERFAGFAAAATAARVVGRDNPLRGIDGREFGFVVDDVLGGDDAGPAGFASTAAAAKISGVAERGNPMRALPRTVTCTPDDEGYGSGGGVAALPALEHVNPQYSDPRATSTPDAGGDSGGGGGSALPLYEPIIFSYHIEENTNRLVPSAPEM